MKRLQPQEAAKFLGCSLDKLYQMCRTRQIPFWKVGSKYGFTEQALTQWIIDQERQSTQSDEEKKNPYTVAKQ